MPRTCIIQKTQRYTTSLDSLIRRVRRGRKVDPHIKDWTSIYRYLYRLITLSIDVQRATK